jgi:hypothetical protein
MLPEVPGIPPKITEIISYLSFDFCNNKLLEREDLAQDLYLLYFKTMKEHKMARNLNRDSFIFFLNGNVLINGRMRLNELTGNINIKQKEWHLRVWPVPQRKKSKTMFLRKNQRKRR